MLSGPKPAALTAPFISNLSSVARSELTVSHAGFTTEKMTNLELNTSESADIPIHLSVAKQTVEQAGQRQRRGGDPDRDVRRQESTLPAASLNTLPVAHQDWTTMLQLNTATIKPLSASTVASTSPQGSGLNVNGLASVGYNLTVDGTNATSNQSSLRSIFTKGQM